ncbi:MAG: DUF3667 domain-containing protein [Gammaproteobacteria bacterium]|nr:DUF3667 domain-containing protein [Gammaproteobacteria bacterium]
MLRELTGDLFEIDSRVWRTLFPLLRRPGFLTTEYLRGRRVHYTPPLRLYLVTSLIFFLFVFVNPASDFDFSEIVLDDETPVTSDPRDPAPNDETPATSDTRGPAANDKSISQEEETNLCSQIGELDFGEIQLKAILLRACNNLAAPGGAGRFLNELAESVPTMMFFFLPVIALFMRVLYLFSGRYYVEHLLFLVHFHSFFFLALTLTVVFSRLPVVLPGQGLISGLLTTIVTFYTPIYLYKALHHVYQQSQTLTALKYLALGVAYFVSMFSLLTALAIFTALHVQ